jgi:putative colanic acid biosynthesis glycosyltransferase
MTKLSIITVAYHNIDGIKQTYDSLKYIDTEDLSSIEWIVIDGGSDDGTADYLYSLGNQFNLKYVSERDRGIYDAMNKGILMSTGDYALFLNSGDVLVSESKEVIYKLCRCKFENVMFIYDAVLDFGSEIKKIRKAKNQYYIYHSLPASHQAIVYPLSELKKTLYDLTYKVSSDYALTATLFKKGISFVRMNNILSSFSIGGISTTNSMELCKDAMRVQKRILKLPSIFIYISYIVRKKTTKNAKNTWESNV